MIERYLQPTSIAQAVELMDEYKDVATWFSGGSKLNATPTKTEKTVAISLESILPKEITLKDNALHIGAMCRIQTLIEHELTPNAIKESAGFIYSRHIRNQATLGGEIAAKQTESLLVPSLLALEASVVLVDGSEQTIEDYINAPQQPLITSVIIPNKQSTCLSYNLKRSAAGLTVVTAAVSVQADGKKRIALGGVSPLINGRDIPVRLRDVEGQDLKGELLEEAVANAINPMADLSGSINYKRYISGVIVADLLEECQQLAQEV